MTVEGAGEPPLVSIVIPAWNAERTIKAAVESALAQRYPKVEVVVVNDGSTDGTGAELATFGERIRVVHQPNGGLPAARNRSHTEARGEFIAWLDADDLMDPDRIALQVEFLLRHPTVILVSSEFTAFHEDGRELPRFAKTYYSRIPDAGGVTQLYARQTSLAPRSEWCHERWGEVQCHWGEVRRDIEWGNIVHPPTVMLRRALLAQVGELDPQGGPAADWEFFIRASRAGDFGLIDVPLLRYRLHPGQMSGPANSRASIVGQLYVHRKTHGSADRLKGLIRRKWSEAHGELYAGLARLELESSRTTAAGYLCLAMVHRPPVKLVLLVVALLALPRGLRNVVLTIKRRWWRRQVAGHLLLLAGHLGELPYAWLAAT